MHDDCGGGPVFNTKKDNRGLQKESNAQRGTRKEKKPHNELNGLHVPDRKIVIQTLRGQDQVIDVERRLLGLKGRYSSRQRGC
jgi:hypothetical protein